MTRRERRKMNSTQTQCSGELAVTPTVDVPPATPAPSTGPLTPEGKSISSRNAIKHGLCAKKLTGPDLEELSAIRARLDSEWEPATETEKMLLQQMALSQWRLGRALELELAAFDGNITPATLSLALRYRTSAERSFYKALSELQRLRAMRREDALREARREREEETTALRRLETQILGPVFATPPEFVSQNNGASVPAPQFVSQNLVSKPAAI
jgi:hypothetical protein